MPKIQMTEDEIADLAEDALNAACLLIQTRIGQTDGGVAGLFFADTGPSNVKQQLIDYIKTEIIFGE